MKKIIFLILILISASFVSSYLPGEVRDSDDGLVLLMHFNNDSRFGESDTFAHDYSGNNHDGVINGSIYNNSVYFDKALYFDGVDDYVNTSFNTHYNLTTISAWVKLDSGGASGFPRIVDKREGGSEVLLFWCLGSTLTFGRHFTDQGQWLTDTDTILLNQWYHVVVVYNETSADNDPLMYINGANMTVHEQLTPSGTALKNSDNYIIGNRGAKDRGFNGTIDEVAIWNRLLSTDEVYDLYLNGITCNYNKTGNWIIDSTNKSRRVLCEANNETININGTLQINNMTSLRLKDTRLDFISTSKISIKIGGILSAIGKFALG